MPITKERLKRIVDAANEAWSIIKNVKAEAESIKKKLDFYDQNGPSSTDTSSLAQNYTNLLIDLKTMVYLASDNTKLSEQNLEAIIFERLHLQRTFKQNEYSKRYHARLRAENKQGLLAQFEEDIKQEGIERKIDAEFDLGYEAPAPAPAPAPASAQVSMQIKNFMRAAWYDQAILAIENGEMEETEPGQLENYKQERLKLLGQAE